MSYLVIQNHGVWYIWLIVQYIVPLEVFTGSFWMGAFNGNTAKRHRLWSNDRGLLQEIVKQGGFCCPHLNRYFWLDLKSSEVVSFSLHELSQVGTWHGVRCNVCRVQTWAWSASTWTRRAKKESLDCLRNSGRASGLSATCNMCVCVRPWLVNACHCKFLCPAHFHLPATSWNCVRAYTPDFGRCIARLATAGLKVHCWWLCAWFGMSAWWHSLRPIWSSDIVLTEWFCKFPQITYS